MQNNRAVKMKNIKNEELHQMIKQKQKFILLDCRTAEEFKCHIHGSILIPYDEIHARHKELMAGKHDNIVVYCRSGRRSVEACKTLEKCGYSNVANVLGGIIGWEANGYEISR